MKSVVASSTSGLTVRSASLSFSPIGNGKSFAQYSPWGLPEMCAIAQVAGPAIL